MMVKPAWACFLSAIVLTFISAGIYAFIEHSNIAQATLSGVSTVVGVDADPTGNTGIHLGTIDRCISVDLNDTFYIDLFVQDVTDLNKWEGTLRFDGSIVQVRSIDVVGPQESRYFLARAADSDVFDGSDPTPNSTGSFLAGALDMAKKPESGSGVLARLEMKAIKGVTPPAPPPMSTLYFTLWWPFGVSGVRLEDQSEAPIGDIDKDANHYFDGLVFNAIVVVDGPCPTDADKDGFTNVEESVDVSDLLDANSTPEVCDGIDNDLDTHIDEGFPNSDGDTQADCVDTDPAVDSDGDTIYNPTDPDDDNDGFSDEREAYLGSDSLADCAQTIYHSAWPLDINNDMSVSFSYDVLPFRGLIGAQDGDDNFRRRLDLNGDGDISFSMDIMQYRGRIGDTCS